MKTVADIYVIQIERKKDELEEDKKAEEDPNFMEDLEDYLKERKEYLKYHPKQYSLNISGTILECQCNNDPTKTIWTCDSSCPINSSSPIQYNFSDSVSYYDTYNISQCGEYIIFNNLPTSC